MLIEQPSDAVELSVIVPVYNEEANIAPLYEALVGSIERLEVSYEIVLVDDGSRDETFHVAAKLARGNSNLRVVKLRNNYGQTPAMVAGIHHSRGRILVTMDGDLQNDPRDIGSLIAKLDEGYDIVVGWRHERQDRLWTRKVPSRLANWLIGKVTGVPIKDNGCSLKAYRGDVIRNVPLYSDMHRFIPAMASVTGARVAELKVRHHPRRFGVSKYGLWRIYKVLLDLLAVKMIISAAERPLWWFSLLALPAAIISIFATLYVVQDMVFKFEYAVSIAGAAVLFGSAAITTFLGGVLCEMIYKTGNTKLNKLAVITATQPRACGVDRRKPRS